MPGLFGVLAKSIALSQEQLGRMALRMADTLRTRPWLHTELWHGARFCGGRVHLGVLNPGPQPLVLGEGGRYVWFDGEIYPPSSERGTTPDAATAQDLIGPSATTKLAETDGLFALACYDSTSDELLLANDRLGYRPLYYLNTPEWFAYASEVKALLAISPSLPHLDQTSLRQFLGFGYMLGERTWWEGIELLPPASLWRVSPQGMQRTRYWSFEAIHREPVPEPEVEREFGRLWERAVRQRSRAGVMPVLLSGGLDSRLLLAELTSQGHEVTAITFGSADSTDVRIARQVTRTAGVPHRALLLDATNWWHRREDAIWQTDGLVNCMDLHVAIATDHLRIGTAYSPMNLAGDLLFGGSYLSDALIDGWREAPELLMETKYQANPLFSREEVVAASLSDLRPYACGPSSDCFYLMQRVRRCTLTGPGAYASHCETVYPSVSQPLLELMLGSLDDRQRIYSRFYNRFLVGRYLAYYGDIPWQRTGRGLAESLPMRGWRGARRRILRLLRQPERPYDQGFADYGSFLQTSQVHKQLLTEKLLADDVTSGAFGQALADSSVRGTSPHALIGMMTLEVYLRQVVGVPGCIAPSTTT